MQLLARRVPVVSLGARASSPLRKQAKRLRSQEYLFPLFVHYGMNENSRGTPAPQVRCKHLTSRPRVMMEFYEILEQILALLQRHGRVTYRALKRQFNLDGSYC